MTELRIERIAKGGDGVARDDDGRVVFVRGGLPGDVVHASVVTERKRHAHARIDQVISPGPGRVDPACVHLGEGCGGCDFQHATLEVQRELKTAIVADALERIGKIAPTALSFAGGVVGTGYRTSVRCAVSGDRAAFHRFHSDSLLAVPNCLVVHPGVRRVMADGRFPRSSMVRVRVGARTGDQTVVVDRGAAAATIPGGEVVDQAEIRRGRAVFVTEVVAGRRWRVSANSFFQSGPEAAELMVGSVRRLLGEPAPTERVCDLYAGVGLLAGGVGHSGPVIAVERAAAAVADARHNLADTEAEVVRCDVEQWEPMAADAVTADPARAGLGRRGVEVIGATGARTCVLVSCDPASLGRDAGLLVAAGFALEAVEVLDLFPQTSHVETVSRFVR